MSSIVSVVKDFKQAFETFSLSTFYNTVLGLPYDSLNAEVELSEIDKLKSDISINTIPDDCLFLTAGVDQQKDRLEITVLGHSEKSLYVLDHRSLLTMNAEIIESPVYRELLAFVKTPFRTVSGYRVPMAWVNVDSGNGTATKTIYRFCSQWANLKAIKGASSVEAPYVPVKITKTGGHELYMIGVNQGKNMVRELINRNTKKGIQVPVRIEISASGVPDDYAEQLMSEELKKSGNTVRWVVKQGGPRNEALDTMNYGYCARLQVTEKIKWHEWRKMQAKQIAQQSQLEPQVNVQDVIEIDTTETITVKEQAPTRTPTLQRRAPKKKRGWL